MPQKKIMSVFQFKQTGRISLFDKNETSERLSILGKTMFARNKKEGQICGFIIGFDFSKDIINAVAQLKNKENIIIELKYIKDIIPYDNPPKVTLTAEELEDLKYKFEATAESEIGVDFFSWDLSHDEKEFKADVVMDKTGVQEKKFTEGEHHIAVQAIDKKGLSGTDKVKIDVKRKKRNENEKNDR